MMNYLFIRLIFWGVYFKKGVFTGHFSVSVFKEENFLTKFIHPIVFFCHDNLQYI